MDTQKYHALLRAIELGSFSAAAEELGYPPSGIRQMAEAVEREMGFPLLLRGRSGIRPTGACQVLLPRFHGLIRAEELLQLDAAELKGLSVGSVTIGAYSSVAINRLPRVLQQFHQDFPQISICLREGIHQELDTWLENREVDFCLYSGSADKSYDWFPLYQDPMLAVLPLSHPMAGCSSFPIEKIAEEPFIMPGNNGGGYDVVHLLEKNHIKPKIEFSTIENFSALAMIECGLGISIMNEGITLGRLNQVVMTPLEPPQHITIGIEIPSLKTGSPATRKMISYLRKMLTALKAKQRP